MSTDLYLVRYKNYELDTLELEKEAAETIARYPGIKEIVRLQDADPDFRLDSGEF